MRVLLSYDFGNIKVFENYIISVMNEGVTVTSEVNKIINKVIDQYFPNKNFIYIAHRIHSYAVDPAVYTEISQIKNLTGVAVVSANRIALNNAEMEKIFTTKPFEIFYTIEEAVTWANTLNNNNNSTIKK
ncbi:hypothetical protein D7030_03295 [Flavobacteriaceae bacterium AU392]|nr:hypothetical protein D1817_09770 [Flavobacteriaceae bacterium]RKM85706.1 hypothetical protein D7030_03295 [Flavobacteriaceae bacterium AU392]